MNANFGLNAKIGDSVNIVGNGRVKIERGFHMTFTANLKSEKNPERNRSHQGSGRSQSTH